MSRSLIVTTEQKMICNSWWSGSWLSNNFNAIVIPASNYIICLTYELASCFKFLPIVSQIIALLIDVIIVINNHATSVQFKCMAAGALGWEEEAMVFHLLLCLQRLLN